MDDQWPGFWMSTLQLATPWALKQPFADAELASLQMMQRLQPAVVPQVEQVRQQLHCSDADEDGVGVRRRQEDDERAEEERARSASVLLSMRACCWSPAASKE